MLDGDGHFRKSEGRPLKWSLYTYFLCSKKVSTFHFEMVLCSEVYRILIFLSKINDIIYLSNQLSEIKLF